jgi:hypothetical protein
MSYSENYRKFVVVLNKRHAVPRLMNAACHAAAGLAATLGAEAAETLAYPNPATGLCAQISRFPFIVLESRNSSQLAALSAAARAAAPAVACNVFVASMIGASAEEQQRATSLASAEDLDFMAVVLFGDATLLDPMTRKFSLLRDSAAAAQGEPYVLVT